MSGGGGEQIQLRTALIVVFVITVVALSAGLLYVFWFRRVFRRRTNTSGGGSVDQLSQYSSSDSGSSPTVSSKEELLYLFCVRSQPSLEYNTVIANTATTDFRSTQRPDVQLIDIDLLKLQGLFVPPRFLFTVKEKEKEDLKPMAEKSLCPLEDKGTKGIDDGFPSVGGMSLEDCFKAAVDESVEATTIEIDDVADQDTTSFETPCASPEYFTPSASPVHEVLSSLPMEDVIISSHIETTLSGSPKV